MTEQELQDIVNQIEAFAAKYNKIWEDMSNVRKPEEKKSFMASTAEFKEDFHNLLALKKDAKDNTPVILACGIASDIIFKYSGQACLATGKKDGLSQIGIEGDDVAELGKLHIAAEDAKASIQAEQVQESLREEAPKEFAEASAEETSEEALSSENEY